jgi:hypothetical protein
VTSELLIADRNPGRCLKLTAARLLVRQAMRDELRVDSEAWRCAERAAAALEGAEGAIERGTEEER